MISFLTTIFNLTLKNVCLFIFVISLSTSLYTNFNSNNYENIIRADGLGYYSYLPAVFIYNDYQYSFTTSITAKYNQVNFGGGFLNKTREGYVNKYYVGLSILCLPFFLLAHFIAIVLGLPADGFSQIYQLSILIASNFYLWIGCVFTKKILEQYLNEKRVIFGILVTVVFGTNLFFYSWYDPAYSHMYSFAMISMFLFYSHLFFETKKSVYLYTIVLLLGIITLLRPTNIVIFLMFLFFAKDLKELAKILTSKKKEIVLSSLLFFITLLPQFILYYLQTGSFFVWSYGEERFYFDSPQFFNVLFSYRKGLFIYTPITFLSLLGLFYLIKRNTYQFVLLSLFLFIITYIISSWWCWWYGSSLSQRAFVDYYSVLALLIGFSYSTLNKKLLKIIALFAVIFCIYYSQILFYQYRYFIIDGVNMNNQKFWFTFLKTDKSLGGVAQVDSFFIENQTVNIVNIKTSTNTFLSSNRSDVDDITANKIKAFVWESFNLILLPNGKFALKSDDNTYVSARLDNGNLLTHHAKEINEWETFEIISKGNSVIIKACNNKFLERKGDNIFATSINENNAERFFIIKK